MPIGARNLENHAIIRTLHFCHLLEYSLAEFFGAEFVKPEFDPRVALLPYVTSKIFPSRPVSTTRLMLQIPTASVLYTLHTIPQLPDAYFHWTTACLSGHALLGGVGGSVHRGAYPSDPPLPTL